MSHDGGGKSLFWKSNGGYRNKSIFWKLNGGFRIKIVLNMMLYKSLNMNKRLKVALLSGLFAKEFRGIL